MPGGRPSKYDPSFCQRAYDYCLLGATDEELAEAFDVATSTLYDWKNTYPEFAEAIKNGKKPADANVASAMFSRATGAEWVEEQAVKLKTVEYHDGRKVREEERVEIVEVKRAAPPDTTAGIFWLKNRGKAHWRDKQDHEVTGKDGGALVVEIVKFGDESEA